MTWKDLKGPGRTWKNLKELERIEINARSGKVWRTEERQTVGVTDKATSREAYASKNLHQKEIFIKYDMSMFFKTWLIQSTFTGCELWLLFIF